MRQSNEEGGTYERITAVVRRTTLSASVDAILRAGDDDIKTMGRYYNTAIQCRAFDEYLALGTLGLVCRYRFMRLIDIQYTIRANAYSSYRRQAAEFDLASTTQVNAIKQAW